MRYSSHAEPEFRQSMPEPATRLAGVFLAALLFGPAAADSRLAEHRLERDYELGLNGAGHVRIEQLAGPVTVESHDADSVTVRLIIHAAGDTETQARERAEAVELEHGREGKALWFRARPSLDEHRTLIYAPPGGDAGYNRAARFAGERVTIRGESGWGRHGVPVYTEVRVQVPPGTGLDLTQQAGPVTVRGLSGPVRLQLQSDAARVSAIEAPLEIDSGNGEVSVVGHRGPARLDAGSAAMHLEDMRGGPFNLRSSSGRIHLRDSSGELTVETGSGGIEAVRFQAGERVAVNSGSGNVRIQGDLSAARELDVASRGGDILLGLAGTPDTRIHVHSTRGNINVNLPGLTGVKDHRTQFTAVAGEGRGEWRLQSRTGRIRVVSETGPGADNDLFGEE